jgi:hypothetical protein
MVTLKIVYPNGDEDLFEVPEPLLQQVLALSKRQGFSMSMILADALDAYVERWY